MQVVGVHGVQHSMVAIQVISVELLLEQVEVSLFHWVDSSQHVPVDGSSTRGRGYTAFVYPSVSGVKHHHELSVRNVVDQGVLVVDLPLQRIKEIVDNLDFFRGGSHCVVVHREDDAHR